MSDDTLTAEERVQAAMEIATVYGWFDGAHHKAWTIDQMLRVLAGDDYANLIREMCDGNDGAQTYTWDEGIAP